MSNLLTETLDVLAGRGISTDEVLWVGSADGAYAMDWDSFAAIADVTYNAGYGSPEVPGDLVIVCKDAWFSRWEYDGSEGWRYNKRPTKARNAKRFSVVVPGRAWGLFVDSLEDAQKPNRYDD